MSNERIDLTQFEGSFGSLLDAVLGGTCTLEDGEGHLHDRMQVILAELNRCYELIDELENPSHEDERYPEPDELTPPNSSRAGADWPSGPSM